MGEFASKGEWWPGEGLPETAPREDWECGWAAGPCGDGCIRLAETPLAWGVSWETLGVADKLGVAGTLASWLFGAAVGVYCEALPENCKGCKRDDQSDA